MTDQQAERTVEARFEIVDFDEDVYEEPADGPNLSRITIRKRYEGVIDGSGVTEVLTARGSAGSGYVASERVEGTLDGKQGTFVIQHAGLDDGTSQTSQGSIVPNSGTGELATISGRAFEREYQVLTLVYRF